MNQQECSKPCQSLWDFQRLFFGPSMLFIIILKALSREIWRGSPEELLYGDELAIINETLVGLRKTRSLEGSIGVKFYRSLFYRYYFSRCFSGLAQLVPLPFSRGRSTRYSDRWHDFSVTIPRCYKGVYVNSFLARPWNSLPIKCFLLSKCP